MEKRELQMTFPGYDLVLSLRGHSAVKNDIFDAAADEIERLRETLELASKPLPSVNWKDGKPYSYCPECGRVEENQND